MMPRMISESPTETGHEAGIEVVLLDVYGTLLRGHRIDRPEDAMRRVAAEFGLEITTPSLDAAFTQAIAGAHSRSPEPWPEVDVREIWRGIFPELNDPETTGPVALAMEQARHVVEPVSGAAEFLDRAADAEITLGLVSNAQAYTESLLEHHFGLERFDSSRHAFSYVHRIAKPDPRLFERALAADDQRGLPRNQVLMIGDSLTNDIVPARSLGLRTCLLPHGGPFPAFDEVMSYASSSCSSR